MNRRTRDILIGLTTGLITGTVVLGIGGRVIMRLIALIGGLEGGYSWGGTIEVVAVGSIIGIISGAGIGLLRKVGSANGLVMGLVYGALTYLIVLVIPIDGKKAALGFPDLRIVVYLLFGGLFLLYGLIFTILYDRFLQES